MSEEAKYQIWMDSREASTSTGIKIAKGLESLGAELHIENLGNSIDYLIPGLNGVRHAIQRKTANEMVRPKKVFEDIIGMRQLDDAESYLLLEGSLGMIQKWSKMPPHAIIGGVESVLLDYNVKIIPSPNFFWTTQWLYQRAKKLGKTKVKKVLSLGESIDKELPNYEKARKILETIPMLGPKLAIRLLQRFETLENTLANVDRWSEIDGIGSEKIATTIEIFKAKYPKEEDTLISASPPILVTTESEPSQIE